MNNQSGSETSLTFSEFSKVNRDRCNRWHPGYPHDYEDGPNSWTGADWSNAMVGEVGELTEALEALLIMNSINSHSGLIANIVKKLRRIESGADKGPDDPDEITLKQMLADEIGDVYAYLDLLAGCYDINMTTAIASKFNRVSERQGLPERLFVESEKCK